MRQKLPAVLSFLLPVVLLLTAFALLGVFPFGEKSLLTLDMNSEYVDYFAHLNRIAREGGSLFRAWEMGMGLNLSGLIAFYTASPLNLIAVLMPIEYLTEAILIMTLLKIGLAGFLFYHYTRYTFSGVSPLICCACSVAWALMGYNIVYSSNIMWLDGTALLPLVLTGVEQLLRENRIRLLCTALTLVFFTSYYIGYMIGIFSFLYLTTVFLSQKREQAARLYLKTLGRFLLGAVIAAGLCAFLLLPAFLQLKNGQDAMWSVSISAESNATLSELVSKLLPGPFDTVTDAGLPNLYSSVTLLIPFTVFFLRSSTSKRERIIFACLGLVLLLSLVFRLPDLAWHAFEDPTWFPARYSFVVTFYILHVALRTFSIPSKPPGLCVCVSAAILAVAFLEVALHRYSHVQSKLLIPAFVVVSFATVLFLLSKWQSKSALIALLVLICAETGYNATVVIHSIDSKFPYQNRADYVSFREKYRPALERMKELDPDMYRVELTDLRNANGGMGVGYRGISHYSTTTDQALNAFLHQLGYNRGTLNELRFATTTPVTNGLLGVRYLLSDKSPGEEYVLMDMVGTVGIWYNPYALPMAFYAPEQAAAFQPGISVSLFDIQNDWLKSLGLTDSNVFVPLQPKKITMDNLRMEVRPTHTAYQRVVSSSSGYLIWELENMDALPVYAYLPVYRRRFSNVKVDTAVLQPQTELAYRHNTVLILGSDTDPWLRLELKSDEMQLAGQYFYIMNQAAAYSAAETAHQHSIEFSEYSDTRVTGRITAPKDGYLVTSFPFDSGWNLTVNGKTVETQRFADVFLSAPISAGINEIRLQYHLPGFRPGLAVTLTTAALCLLHMVQKHRAKVHSFSDGQPAP